METLTTHGIITHQGKKINRIMSEELLLNDRRGNSGAVAQLNISLSVQKQLTTLGFEPWISRSLTRNTPHSAISPCILLCCDQIYFSNKLYFGVRLRDHSKLKNESQRMF